MAWRYESQIWWRPIIKYLCIHRVYMATLYWRLKRRGKWTWEKAEITAHGTWGYEIADPKEEEE